MQLGFGLSTFHVPIVHLNKHEKHVRNAILFNVCLVCFEWFITNDIIIVFVATHTTFLFVCTSSNLYNLCCRFFSQSLSFTYISGKAWALVLCMKSKSKLQWTCILNNNGNKHSKRKSIICNKVVNILYFSFHLFLSCKFQIFNLQGMPFITRIIVLFHC